MPWLVRTVRFTSFLTPDAVADGDLWRSVLGGEPERTVHQRTAGLRQETGPFEDAVANLTIQPGRVDWVFGPVETPAPQWETLGTYPAAMQRYLAPVSRWVGSEQFPSIRRLALGVLLVEPTETVETGYARLRHFIDAVPQGEATDFLYQVNRYRPSGVMEGLNINRLAKWSVSQLQLFTVSAGMQSAAPPLSVVTLDLDVNTSAEFSGHIPPASVGPLLEDLQSAANEIATRGDRIG
jgi:hypothetical protein